MNTKAELKQALNYLDIAESNIHHYSAMLKVCDPANIDTVEQLDRQLHWAELMRVEQIVAIKRYADELS